MYAVTNQYKCYDTVSLDKVLVSICPRLPSFPKDLLSIKAIVYYYTNLLVEPFWSGGGLGNNNFWLDQCYSAGAFVL
jgi:hypothetical protein